MHATIDVRFTISIDDDKTIPLATLAEFVSEQNIESVLLESMVESLDAARVEALCVEKHAHGNGDQRYQRAGTDTRIAVTTTGEHEFNLHYVEDTADNSRSLLDLSVNGDWDETASDLNEIDAVTDNRSVVSDGKSGIVTAFTQIAFTSLTIELPCDIDQSPYRSQPKSPEGRGIGCSGWDSNPGHCLERAI